jgi:hypothetical protein
MNNITSQLPFGGLFSRNSSGSDIGAAAYSREQSVRASESLEAGLVIETSEGDLVTLSASSFSELDAFMYDSAGVVRTEAGTALYSEQQRGITLASGQSFSFTVEGDLNKEELKDIESILKGLDGVISEMRQGDMGDALKEAMKLGDYDTVSSYAADITYERSVEVSSSVAAVAQTHSRDRYDSGAEGLEEPIGVSDGGGGSLSASGDPELDFARLLNKMLKRFGLIEGGNSLSVKNPVEQLFQHHQDDSREKNEPEFIQDILTRGLSSVESLFEILAAGEDSDD